jgi:hypothetical protein
MNYFVARDLMEHRKVKMLVLGAPASVHRSNQPHVQLFRVVRYGDHPAALDGLGLRLRMALFAANVLGAPRQALNLLRPNLIEPGAGLGAEPANLAGYKGAPFRPHRIIDPKVPASELIYSGTTSLFRFDGPPLNELQAFFLRKTIQMGRQHGAQVVILHMPSPSERGMDVIPERQVMPSLIEPDIFFVGVSSERMFRDIPSADFFDYFQDEHVNLNGNQLYTEAISPALIQLYEQHEKTH